MQPNLPTFKDVSKAAERLKGVAYKTPVRQSRALKNASFQGHK
jgi:threonine dehydratase